MTKYPKVRKPNYPKGWKPCWIQKHFEPNCFGTASAITMQMM